MLLSQSSKEIARHLTLLMLAISAGAILYALLAQLSGILTVENYQPNPVGQVRFILLKVVVPWGILSPLVALVATKFPLTPNKLLWPALAHVLLFLGFSLAHGLVISLSYHYLEDMTPAMHSYQPWQHIGHFLFGDGLLLFNLIIYTILIASFNLKSYFTLTQQKELDEAELKQELLTSQLQALRMQINPHFLFNSLNALSSLILKQANQQALNMLDQLCDFLRQTLNQDQGLLTPLAHELNTIQQYLAIEQIRFGDRLTVRFNCNPSVANTLVPTLLLQPLVENAMVHGLSETETNGLITIDAKQQGSYVMIQISDNGVGCDFSQIDPGRSIGISNIKQRLEKHYGERYLLHFDGKPKHGVTVTIKLPLDRQGTNK